MKKYDTEKKDDEDNNVNVEVDKIVNSENKPKFYPPIELKKEENIVDVLKNKTIKTLESGQVTDPRQQYTLIEETIIRLLPFLNDNNKKIAVSYFIDQAKLELLIEDKQKEIQVLMDEYGKNVKDVYDGFIKKL